MPRTSPRFRRFALVVSAIVAGASTGCGGSDPTLPPKVDLTGSYVATYFRVTPTGKPTIDVLARGGSLTLKIAADKSTTGTLSMPADVFGSAPVSANMAGTAHVSGYSVRFEQAVSTFVNQLGWIAGGGTISTDVNDGSARIEVLLTRQ
jgi:hypothetical protein